MLRVYLGGAVGLVAMGQMHPAGGQPLPPNPSGQQLLDQALSSDPSMGTIMTEAGKIASLGIQPTDAAIIVALSGLAWKFLDTSQKGGVVDTLNQALRRALKVDNPPPPPRA